MFRRLFESPSDAGQVIVVPDENISGEPDVQQLIVDRINEVNSEADAALAGGADQEVATEGGEEQSAAAPEGQSTEDLILGRFRTNEDLATAYQNLEPEYTQTRQQMRELERQVQELTSQLQYANEFEEEPQNDFHFESPYSNSPRNVEELEALAEQSPDKAAIWAIQNSERLNNPELVQEVVNYWHQRNPAQATAYMLQQMMQGYVPQIEQRLAPHDNSRQEAIITTAVNAAEQQIGPSYGDYHDRIVDTIEANPALLPQDMSDTGAMTQAIINVYAMLVGMDQLQRGKQLAAQGAPTPAPQAQTQTRQTAGSTAPSNTGNVPQEDIEAARTIQNLILNAQA
jgi:hypothetical protein